VVEQDEPGLLIGRHPGGVNAVFGGDHVEIPLFEETAEDFGVDLVVVDDQNLLGDFDDRYLTGLES
jgi:hypothetical protein